MSRPSRAENLMAMARVAARRSTCDRMEGVGVVIARDGRVLVTGYNGAPAGMKHCDHSQDHMGASPHVFWVNGIRQDHPGCMRTLHAEVNAIAYAARFGVSIDQSTMYSTHSPCLACCQLIVNSGIVKVVYATEYRITEGLDLLRKARIETEHLVIDLSSGI